MRLFRRGKGTMGDVPTGTTHLPAMDLSRFERLVEAGVRLRDLGIDYEEIQRRASAEGVSWNEALESIDRECSDEAASSTK